MFKNGISTGLMLWLFFLVAFVFLGYPVPLSIIVSAIGGLSGGIIVTWWKSSDLPPPQIASEEEEELIVRTNHRMGIVEAQRQRKAREDKTLRGQVFAMQQLRAKLRRSLLRRR
ncbi:hypothetical protein [Spirulina sp. 06S082]|uniref:hypothetical protein n=1 Tax=Spirulina sp. 06S082 TaxID=3110248 RepID=UPI002B1FFA85|nr:hypothetical protein [Spirulina sp. 06S082]MEA5467672.1 hypothetical protein [Spirulina sp. 06S082]